MSILEFMSTSLVTMPCTDCFLTYDRCEEQMDSSLTAMANCEHLVTHRFTAFLPGYVCIGQRVLALCQAFGQVPR